MFDIWGALRFPWDWGGSVRDALSKWGMPGFLHFPRQGLALSVKRAPARTFPWEKQNITSSKTRRKSPVTKHWLKTPKTKPDGRNSSQSFVLLNWFYFLVFTHSIASSFLFLWSLLSASLTQALIRLKDLRKWITDQDERGWKQRMRRNVQE